MLPEIRTPIPGTHSLRLAADLRRHESRNITFIDPDGRFPVFWESAKDCLVTDVDGNVFLDMTAAFGVASVGHSNEKVGDAISRQARKLIHGMGDVHPSALKNELAAKVCERTPGNLAGCIFGANGGDAIEAAIKTAKLYTGKPDILACTGGYHGLTFGAMAVTHHSDFRAPFAGQTPPFARHIPYANPDRCVFGCGRCTTLCLKSVEATLAASDTIGAVLVEPIQGRGGIVVPPDGWLSGLRELCDRHRVLLILDEIFTGWCRTGHWFACENEGVVPDILCVGKAMGGGFPISVCLGKPDVMTAWPTTQGEAIHTSTFLGSPLGCAASLAAIGEMEARGLVERARAMGAYLGSRLRELQETYPHRVKEVRGRGLMLGVQFFEREVALGLVYELLQRGVIVLAAGNGDVIELVPPLIIETVQIDYAVSALGDALGALQ